MSDFTVTRTLKAPQKTIWQVLTEPSHFEGWLPAKPGTAVLDVRTGGSWRATVISSEGEEIALTGRYTDQTPSVSNQGQGGEPTADALALAFRGG